MRTSVEPLEGNKVKLSVEVDEGEFDDAVEAAFRKLGRQVRIPGFRPGKAPRRLLEARLGSDAAREEALHDSLPAFYEKALKENDVQAIAPPEIDITGGRESGAVVFDAVVEVMPTVQLAGYQGLRVSLPNLDVSDDEVDRQVDRLREQFGELHPVTRPATDGDHVRVDRRVYRHDETITAVEDELHEVGNSPVAAEIDEQLRGAKVGDILKFNATVPEHGEVTFQLLVKEVSEKILPEVTDEWASEASEFDTAQELRDDIRRRMDAVKRLEAALAVQDKVVEALVELVDEEMPEALVQPELERRIHSFVHRIEHQGINLDQFLDMTGRSRDELVAHVREEAVAAVKANLALRAVADAEGIEVSDEEVDQEVLKMAERLKEKPEAVRRRLDHEDQMPAVRSGIRKSKALEWLIEHTEYVDEEGRVIDRSELTPSPAGVVAAASTDAEETAE